MVHLQIEKRIQKVPYVSSNILFFWCWDKFYSLITNVTIFHQCKLTKSHGTLKHYLQNNPHFIPSDFLIQLRDRYGSQGAIKCFEMGQWLMNIPVRCAHDRQKKIGAGIWKKISHLLLIKSKMANYQNIPFFTHYKHVYIYIYEPLHWKPFHVWRFYGFLART